MTPSRIRNRRPVRSGKNSTRTEKTNEKLGAAFVHVFGNKLAVIAIAVTTSVIIVLLSIYWFDKSYADPKRAFWGTVANNLSTYGVTKEFKQQNESGSVAEFTQLVFNPNTVVRDLKKVNTQSESGKGKVIIESIGTAKDTYQHYALIDQPAASMHKPDYSGVYQLWLKNGGNLNSHSAQLFNNAVFGAMLFGNMPAATKSQAVDYLKKAYKIDFDKVNRNSGTSRRIYTYDSKINLKEYAKAASFYAKTMGLPNSKQINPDNYKSSDQLNVIVKIDVKARQLKEITYKSTANTEKYSGYGISGDFKVPSKTVSYDKLQNAINSISQ